MGGCKSCSRPLTEWEIQYIAQSLNIGPHAIHSIYNEFKGASGRDCKLNPKEFRKLYKRLYPYSRLTRRQLHHLTKKVFLLCDRDGSGKLSFNEFLSVLVMIEGSGSPRDKVQFAMTCMSPDGQLCENISMNNVKQFTTIMDSIYHSNNSADICGQLTSYGDEIPMSTLLSTISSAEVYQSAGNFSSSDFTSDD